MPKAHGEVCLGNLIELFPIKSIMVVITQDSTYLEKLTADGLLALCADPTDDHTLRSAGVNRARAMMVLLDNDAEALLTVLTARGRNPSLYITAATHSDEINMKITRVGSNNVIQPLEVAGRFLNNATLRPAVNDYFNSILFDQKASEQIVQLYLSQTSHWADKTIGELDLRGRFRTGIIGLRNEFGRFYYAPGDDHQLKTGDIILAVVPGRYILAIQQDCCAASSSIPDNPNWQRLPSIHHPPESDDHFSLHEAEQKIMAMSSHYIICGSGEILRSALEYLNPKNPFVVLTNDQTLLAETQKRGFRVIHGDPTHDNTLKRAGVDRALAIMVSIEHRADAVLTTLSCRSLNRDLLIVATATADDMIPRLRRAGADRVVTPFRIAAQFVLLATTRPVVSDFIQHILYNYETGYETTELYIQDDNPWIGMTWMTSRWGRLTKAG